MRSTPMRSRTEFGMVLSQFTGRFDHVLGDASAAEAAGLDSVWLVDHLLAPGAPERPIYEAWTALAAVAARTERVRLGHLVNAAPFRNVGVFAKMATTLDHVSNGRLEVGLGAGWYETEFAAFGIPFRSPGDRRRHLEELVAALRLLWLSTEEPVSFDGAFVKLQSARVVPGPVQDPGPPIVIGAGGPLLRRFAGEVADTWNCPAGLLPEFVEARQVVVDAAARAGRSVRVTLQIPVAVGRTREEADAALAVAATHLAWMGDVAAIGIVGTVEEAAERIRRYRDQGADGFIGVLPGSRMRPDFIAAYGEAAALARS